MVNVCRGRHKRGRGPNDLDCPSVHIPECLPKWKMYYLLFRMKNAGVNCVLSEGMLPNCMPR